MNAPKTRTAEWFEMLEYAEALAVIYMLSHSKKEGWVRFKKDEDGNYSVEPVSPDDVRYEQIKLEKKQLEK